MEQSTRSEPSCIPDVVVGDWSTSLIGKGMDRRRGHGFSETISWIRLLWRNSTLISLIGQHPGQEVDHHVVGPLGPQERAVERGVMSQISQAPPPILHNDHNHLNSNSSHLYPIFTQSLQHYLSTHLIPVSCPISTIRSGLTSAIRSNLPVTYL